MQNRVISSPNKPAIKLQSEMALGEMGWCQNALVIRSYNGDLVIIATRNGIRMEAGDVFLNDKAAQLRVVELLTPGDVISFKYGLE